MNDVSSSICDAICLVIYRRVLDVSSRPRRELAEHSSAQPKKEAAPGGAGASPKTSRNEASMRSRSESVWRLRVRAIFGVRRPAFAGAGSA